MKTSIKRRRIQPSPLADITPDRLSVADLTTIEDLISGTLQDPLTPISVWLPLNELMTRVSTERCHREQGGLR